MVGVWMITDALYLSFVCLSIIPGGSSCQVIDNMPEIHALACGMSNVDLKVWSNVYTFLDSNRARCNAWYFQRSLWRLTLYTQKQELAVTTLEQIQLPLGLKLAGALERTRYEEGIDIFHMSTASCSDNFSTLIVRFWVENVWHATPCP